MSLRFTRRLAAAVALLAAPALAAITPTTPRLAEARLPNGVRLRFAEQGRAGGRAVVLLHGYSDSWASFAHVMPLLPDSLHAIAPDLRGHGGSDRPATGYAMRDLAADVVALMDARGVTRATVVGHSMGSIVAQQVALLAPDRVEGLVLIGSGRSIKHMQGIDEMRGALAEFSGDDAPVSEKFARDFQLSTLYRPIPAGFLDTAVHMSRQLPLRVWRAVLDGMLSAPEPAGLAAHGIPTLIVWGDRDAYFLRPEQQALRAMLPRATFREYAATGHAVHWERPVPFARDLAQFVAALPRTQR